MSGNNPVTGGLADFVRSIGAEVGGGAIGLVLIMALYSLFEGLAMSMLLPVLQQLGMAGGMPNQGITPWLSRFFESIGQHSSLPSILGTMAVFFLVQQVLFLLHKWIAARQQAAYTLYWRKRLFSAVFASRWSYFTSTRSSDIANAIMRECERINLAFYNVIELAVSVMLVVIYVALALAMLWQGALFLTCLGASVYLLTRPILRRSVKAGHQITESNESLTKAVHEYLAGAKLVKATAMEAQAVGLFSELAGRSAALVRMMSFQPAQLRAAFELSGMFGLLAMVGIGVGYLQLNPGAILVTAYLFLRLHARVSTIQQTLNNLNFYLAGFYAARRIIREAEAHTELVDVGEIPDPNNLPMVELDELTVSYGDHLVLDQISLRIAPGETVAFVGPSGAGKSTLVDSIVGLVQATTGTVTVDGRPLSELSLRAWRQLIGYVGQETYLFNASISDNIRWAKPGASDVEVEKAARRANVHEFVSRMANGYEAVTGDSGVRLSGGQKQRIGLARALLGNRRVLILDEATSALDSASEAAVMEAIRDLHGDISVLMVAHRLSTVRHADCIYVLVAGRIVESGPWDELMARRGVFFDMWQLQNTASDSALDAVN